MGAKISESTVALTPTYVRVSQSDPSGVWEYVRIIGVALKDPESLEECYGIGES